jgi:hypothetical protein
MKAGLFLSLTLLAIIPNSVQAENNFSYYKDLIIRTLTYPFRQFWNSSRTTKIMTIGAVGAVGALLILGDKLSGKLSNLQSQIIDEQLDGINNAIRKLESVVEAKSSKKPRTLLSNIHAQNDTKELVTEIQNLINVLDLAQGLAPNRLSDEQTDRFEKLKKELAELKLKIPTSKN